MARVYVGIIFGYILPEGEDPEKYTNSFIDFDYGNYMDHKDAPCIIGIPIVNGSDPVAPLTLEERVTIAEGISRSEMIALKQLASDLGLDENEPPKYYLYGGVE